MKRRILEFAVLLLLGAIVNVVVAWGCLNLPQSLVRRIYYWERSDDANEVEVEWLRREHPDLTIRTIDCDASERSSIGWSAYVVIFFPPDGTGIVTSSVTRLTAGFPVRSFSDTEVLHPGERSRFAAWLFPTSSSGVKWNWIRLQPVWCGFVLNAAFYAGALWMLLVFPFSFRRWLRIKRGLCPACAYPVGTSTICTECGAALRARVGH